MFCSEPVDERYAAYPLRPGAFEVTRAQGGANRILGREREPGKIAHVRCAEQRVRERQRGITEGQGTLV
jgi:hypothetical protein